MWYKKLVLILYSLTCIAGLQSYSQERPNIIFIITDDQRWDALGYAGNDILQTPNMDNLAASGVFFENAFVTTPICAASRATMLTGLYERTHEYTFDTPPLQETYMQQSYPHLLKQAGYYTGYFGKFGVNVENKAHHNDFDAYDEWGTGAYWQLTGPGWSEHIHITELMGVRANDFIEKAPTDRPFCLTLGFNAPHAADQEPDQYIYPPFTKELYADETIPPPMYGDPAYFNEQPEFVKQGLNYVRWKWRFDTPEKYQAMVKAHYRMISGVDKIIGDIRETLEAKELEGNTIIILIGDNGYFLGERGFAGKWLMYEHSLRVPLIIYDPRNPVSDENNRISKMVLNTDIAPTILTYAGITPPARMDGSSLEQTMHRTPSNSAWRNETLIEHLFDMEFIPQSEGVRTTDWKYFRYRHHPGYEELYHLKTDPWENNNLAKDPAFEDKLIELRQKTDRLIQEKKDKRVRK